MDDSKPYQMRFEESRGVIYMLTEESIRKKVKALKGFYMDLVNYAFVNVVLILIWLTFDPTGTFWPKYVIVVWGFALMFRAYRMGVVPLFFNYISFLTHEWEEKKVEEMMGKRHSPKKISLRRDEKEG